MDETIKPFRKLSQKNKHVKGVLNNEHIDAVKKEAQNQMYYIYNAVSFAFGTRNPLAIHKITREGLVFIVGTDDTGFTHIHRRHSGNSGEDFWDDFKDDKGQVVEKFDNFGRRKYRLDNPSNFHPHSIPIFDYLSVADQVYSSGQLQIEKNKHKDLFDVYEGLATCLNREEIRYRLVLYKDSKIVHTLIPLTKKFNSQEKYIVHFARQKPRAKLRLMNDDFQIEIPYVDEYEIERYVVIIRDNPQNNQHEKWYVQANTIDGTPLVTEYFNRRVKDMDIRLEEYLWRLENIDFTSLEKFIKQMDELIIPAEH